MIEHPEIPKGYYCYRREGRISIDLNKTHGTFQEVRNLCPHWGSDPTQHSQENGYCRLLNLRDWEHGTLLWDQVKECNFNIEDDDEGEILSA